VSQAGRRALMNNDWVTAAVAVPRRR
jgi:hypothetical protein